MTTKTKKPSARERLVNPMIEIIVHRRILKSQKPYWMSDQDWKFRWDTAERRIREAHLQIEAELIRKYKLQHLLKEVERDIK